ncbi:hypothetical protein F7725_014011 [Dissostichus mawsoni]|uniref:Neurotransmitter-gated ion-channel ligand-binding domain-containing protein n=1 Tax=Dissostichus mawsoni TaxID=36200 RepID=A0A7J5YVW7_DISMA|nr:hypothetical protein F7725_014011 [Dissostichus mawsoni]
MEESNSLEKLPDELSEAVKALSLLLSRKEERKPDYWNRVARKLDKVLFFVYVTVASGSTNNNSKDDNNNEGLEKGLGKGLERGLGRRLERGLEKGLEKGLGKGLERGLERDLRGDLRGNSRGNLRGNSRGDLNGDSRGGSSWNTTELLELQDDLKSNQSFEASGETINNSEQRGLNGQLSDKDKDNDYKRKFPYEDVLNYLNLTENKERLVRPTKHFKTPTWVFLQMSIMAILDVREIDQTFVSFVGIYMKWEDPHIFWIREDFGGLDRMRVPSDLLWKPDLMIEEMIEKDKDVPIPFITIHSNGFVEHVRDLMVVSTCRMQIYKFPFDIQSCTLSLKSIIYPEEELQFDVLTDNRLITEWTRQMMRNESEWFLIDITVQPQSVPRFYQKQSVVIYTIRMKRRSALYIVNFLVPILFFFCLDLASFLMSDSGSEKVSFKVTVLLAVTVMQLILTRFCLPLQTGYRL